MREASERNSLQATNRKALWFEIAVVFGLSLGASALYSIVSLIAALTAEHGLGGSSQTLNPSMATREWLDFTYQILDLALGMMPVLLALYLLWQTNHQVFKSIGLVFSNWPNWLGRSLLLAAGIGIPGIGLYLAARALGLSAKITPAALPSYWWAVPVLLLAAVRAAALEEVLVIGYLFDRLEKLGFSNRWQIFASAIFRGSYHLYQGFGGFIGNLVMGLVFGWFYRKYGKLTPLLVAHFVLDAVTFVGFATLGNLIHLP
jgi:membrane protease YdiL (CAAX protease family)